MYVFLVCFCNSSLVLPAIVCVACFRVPEVGQSMLQLLWESDIYFCIIKLSMLWLQLRIGGDLQGWIQRAVLQLKVLMKKLSRNHLYSSGQGKVVRMEMMVGNSIAFCVLGLYRELYCIRSLLSSLSLFLGMFEYYNLAKVYVVVMSTSSGKQGWAGD